MRRVAAALVGRGRWRVALLEGYNVLLGDTPDAADFYRFQLAGANPIVDGFDRLYLTRYTTLYAF
jgi:hypothetical protein